MHGFEENMMGGFRWIKCSPDMWASECNFKREVPSIYFWSDFGICYLWLVQLLNVIWIHVIIKRFYVQGEFIFPSIDFFTIRIHVFNWSPSGQIKIITKLKTLESEIENSDHKLTQLIHESIAGFADHRCITPSNSIQRKWVTNS